MALSIGTKRPVDLFWFRSYNPVTGWDWHLFDTSQDINTPPTRWFGQYVPSTQISHPTLRTGNIRDITYYMKPTNPVTYTLRLWQDNPTFASGGDAGLNLIMQLLFQSAPAKASATRYEEAVNIPFSLQTPGIMWHSLEWTGAPGPTSGYIKVLGEVGISF